MANSSPLGLIIATLLIAFLIFSVRVKGEYYEHGGLPPAKQAASCQGSATAECNIIIANASDGFEMDSEISRRILATSDYISYGALTRNTVPCSRRGASYYNCRPSAQANPYTRGCIAITRCRS